MPTPEAELKARLMADAAATIDQVLAMRKAPAEASLADIEQVARTAGQQLAQAVTVALVAEERRRTARLAGVPHVWAEDEEQGPTPPSGGDRNRRSRTGAYLLPLCCLRPGAFSPWMNAGR